MWRVLISVLTVTRTAIYNCITHLYIRPGYRRLIYIDSAIQSDGQHQSQSKGLCYDSKHRMCPGCGLFSPADSDISAISALTVGSRQRG
mmetsp:Transcript_10092/g.15297  ORF Transcript_10092/g.15297 Transcript_10092/m.15297 type:complete len:89 (+) Transcript_10092:114-380(+)